MPRLLVALLCGVSGMSEGRVAAAVPPQRLPMMVVQPKPAGEEQAADGASSRRLSIGSCPATCAGSGLSCDEVTESYGAAYTCAVLENDYNCDCGGCYCGLFPSAAPTRSSSPTTSLAPTRTHTLLNRFSTLDQACEALDSGDALTAEVANDDFPPFPQQFELDGYADDRCSSLRLYGNPAESRKVLSGSYTGGGDCGNAKRLFYVINDAKLELEHLEFSGGCAQDDGGFFTDGEPRGGLFYVQNSVIIVIGCLLRDSCAGYAVRGARSVCRGRCRDVGYCARRGTG